MDQRDPWTHSCFIPKVVHEVNTNRLILNKCGDSCKMSQITPEMSLECLEGKKINQKIMQIHFV